jgi:hypothetical protein
MSDLDNREDMENREDVEDVDIEDTEGNIKLLKEQISDISNALSALTASLQSGSKDVGPQATPPRSTSSRKRKISECNSDPQSLFNAYAPTVTEEIDSFLEEFGGEIEGSDKVGPPIREKLASIVNARFEDGLSYDKLDEKIKIYTRPSNCSKLTVPRVNHSLFRNMSVAAKAQDKLMVSMHKCINTATTAILQVADALLENKSNDLAKKALDAIALLGHSSRELSKKRREAVAFDTNKSLLKCSLDTIPVNEYLFGEESELGKQIAELKRLDKLTQEQPKNWYGRPWKGARYNRNSFRNNLQYQRFKQGSPGNSRLRKNRQGMTAKK